MDHHKEKNTKFLWDIILSYLLSCSILLQTLQYTQKFNSNFSTVIGSKIHSGDHEYCTHRQKSRYCVEICAQNSVVNLTYTTWSHLKESQFEKYPDQTGLWPCLWGIVSMSQLLNDVRESRLLLGSATTMKVVWLLQESRMSKPQGTSQWASFLCGLLFISCLQVPALAPLSDWLLPLSINWINPLVSQVASGQCLSGQ